MGKETSQRAWPAAAPAGTVWSAAFRPGKSPPMGMTVVVVVWFVVSMTHDISVVDHIELFVMT